ncbi:MAG: GAF sensor signal transduction histidine kinase [Parcubacteria group bacterium Gr01-1014_30]|nr:MAG: GAF sensor signal transduction histidine kinase [Parcubacteria group bacterium Gr01-1014_30]
MLAKDKEKPKLAEVVSITAHYLRNPLTIIRTYLEALIFEDLGKINQKQKEYLLDALENVKRMKETVNQFLDIFLVEEKRYKMILEPAVLGDLTDEVIGDFSLLTKASNCEVFFRKPKNLPKVLTNQLKIRQVIENLISNALKYKRIGRGKIEIALVKSGKNIVFSCKDDGIGIPHKDFKKVFTKFYRSEQAIESDPSGAGLGLYINKAIIELSGGKIWFKKNKDFGMTFYFRLPIAQV